MGWPASNQGDGATGSPEAQGQEIQGQGEQNRKIIYTTNIIEGLNPRQIMKNKPSFASGDFPHRMLYLAAAQRITKR
jgi:hypothetical protein